MRRSRPGIDSEAIPTIPLGASQTQAACAWQCFCRNMLFFASTPPIKFVWWPDLYRLLSSFSASRQRIFLQIITQALQFIVVYGISMICQDTVQIADGLLGGDLIYRLRCSPSHATGGFTQHRLRREQSPKQGTAR